MTIRYLTAGESHGPALCGIIDGVPPHIKLSQTDFDDLLRLRQSGYGRGQRQKIEFDKAEILSGIIGGETTGAPISLIIRNKDFENNTKYMHPFNKIDTSQIINIPLPGHADLPGLIKYGFKKDCRPVRERASARNTATLVALSVPVRAYLKTLNIFSLCLIESLGGIDAKINYNIPFDELNELIQKNSPDFLTPDSLITQNWKNKIDDAKRNNKSLGGTGCVIFYNLPVGLGSYVQHDSRLDGKIASEVMSIPGIKGIEIGNAYINSRLNSNTSDDIFLDNNGNFYRKTNKSGGLEGGMTNGMPLVVRFRMKPLPGGNQAKDSVDLNNNQQAYPIQYRSDTCALQAACIAVESVIAITIASELA